MKKSNYIFLLFLLVSKICLGQLYTEYANPSNLDSLVQNVFASPSVQIKNVTYIGDEHPKTGDIRDIGYFNSTKSTVGINSGLIITGGWLEAPYGLGQPAYKFTNTDKYTNGDSILDQIVSPFVTSGAAVLEFDFVPNGDSIKFNYVFASDEYPTQVCHEHNDVFVFHISGEGITGIQNMATVPNTDLPVGNNTINDTSLFLFPQWFVDTSLCVSLGHTQYYVDHQQDNDFIFNGSTTVLTAASATVPCKTYHLRLAIANGGEKDYGESPAVFLEANSFNSEPLSLESKVTHGNNDTILYEGCGYAQIVFRRTYNIQEEKTYSLGVSGTALNGLDYTNLPSTITMKKGQMYDTLLIYPAADFINDPLESVILKVGDRLCNGQYYETSIELIIYEKPDFDLQIDADTSSICGSITFSALTEGAFAPLNFNWNDGQSESASFDLAPKFEGFSTSKEITLSVTDNCGTIVHDTINQAFYNPPRADFSFSPTYAELNNPLIEFTDRSLNDANSWHWDFGANNTGSSDQNTYYVYPDTGNYEVTLLVNNKLDCQDSITKTVRISEISDVNIPNVFTPNGDGEGDFWQITGLKNFKSSVKIYNRWGNLIFNSFKYKEPWDGTYQGKPAPVGTYYYMINITDPLFEEGQREFKGQLQIIR